MYQLPWVDNPVIDAFTRLAKDISCPYNKSIIVEVHIRQILALINLVIIE